MKLETDSHPRLWGAGAQTCVLVLALVAASGAGSVFWKQARAPRFHGAPLHRWVADLNASDVAVQDRAREVLLEIGPTATPALVHRLNRSDSFTDAVVEWIRARGPAVVQRWCANWSTEGEIRSAAARTLERMGPDAAEATGALIKALSDSRTDVRAIAFSALSKIGRPAVPVLTDELPTAEATRRCVTFNILAAMGTNAVSAVPRVRPFLHDPSAEVRLASAAFLCAVEGRREQLPTGVAHVVSEVIRTGHARERRAALTLIKQAGVADPELAAAVSEAARSADPYVVVEAAEALGLVWGRTSEAIRVFVGTLRDADHNVRWRAVTGLQHLLPESAVAMPSIIEATEDSDRYVRSAAVTLLGKMGEAAKPAVPALQKAAKDPDTLVQSNAAESLWKVDPTRTAPPRAME